MDDQQPWTRWLKKPSAWITGTISLASAIIGFILLLRDNYHLGVTVLGTLAVAALFSAFLFLALARRLPKIPGGKGVYFLDDKYRPFAFVGVGLILGLVCALLILKHSREFIIYSIVGTAEPTPIVTRSNTLTPMPTAAVLRSELVAILTHHETYFTAMDDQTGWNWELKSEEDKIQNWERFTLLHLDNGKVALKTYHGRFVTATGDDGCCNWTLRAETLDRGVSEEFSLVDAGDGKVAFETHQGRYVSATSAGQCWQVRAETTHLDDWEKFTLISLE